MSKVEVELQKKAKTLEWLNAERHLESDKYVRLNDVLPLIAEERKWAKHWAHEATVLKRQIADLKKRLAETKKLLSESQKKLISAFPSTKKIEVFDSETKETWIVKTANPEQWHTFEDVFDEFLVELKKEGLVDEE